MLVIKRQFMGVWWGVPNFPVLFHNMPPIRNSACCVYDFTCWAPETAPQPDDEDFTSWVLAETLKIQLKLVRFCKKWCFQLEAAPSTGRLHWQGRFSLKLKARVGQIPFELGHYTRTSTANRDNQFYVCKDETRVAGPWKDTTMAYIPRQVRGIQLRSWQKSVVDTLKVWDTRKINIVLCADGNIGKSTLVTYCRAHKLAHSLPPVNDYRDLMRIVYHYVHDLNNRSEQAFFIDMPRGLPKSKLGSLYSGIESIKDGFCFDDRYQYKEVVFDCPVIWVFTNTMPDLNYLSKDRWAFWEVRGETLYSAQHIIPVE